MCVCARVCLYVCIYIYIYIYMCVCVMSFAFCWLVGRLIWVLDCLLFIYHVVYCVVSSV